MSEPIYHVTMTVAITAAAVVELIRSRSRGVSKAMISIRLGCSAPTVQRAIKWLRDDLDAPIFYDRRVCLWRMDGTSPWTMPTFDLTPQGFVARSELEVRRVA